MSFQSPRNRLAYTAIILLGLVLISSQIFKGPFKDAKFPNLNFTSKFSFTFNQFSNSKLKGILENNLKDKKGYYSIYIEDLMDGENYTLNEKESFPAASLYKLYLMAAVLKEVEGGSLSLDTKISDTKSRLAEVFGELDFGYEDAPAKITYTIDEILIRIGRISDNFASIMLLEKIGRGNLLSVIRELGAQNTIIEYPTPKTQASDIAIFFKKLYLKEVINRPVSEEIKKYLSLNSLNNRIPAKLPKDGQNHPEGWEVIHKTGELSRLRHDAGLIYIKDEPDLSATESADLVSRAYVIVLLSKDLADENEGVETLANISRDVYEYFKSKSGPIGN